MFFCGRFWELPAAVPSWELSHRKVLEMEDVNRFPNHLIETGGHFHWDIYELYRHIIEGLKIVAQKKDVEITSIGIDTWGVDLSV